MQRGWTVAVLLAAAIGSAGVVYLAAGRMATGTEVGVLLFASFVISVDLWDLLGRLYLRSTPVAGWKAGESPRTARPGLPLTPTEQQRHLRPYAIILSVHNLDQGLHTFLDAIAPYRDHLWLIDDCSSDATRTRLRFAGCRCLKTPVNRKKPGAIKDLLQALPPDIETVLVMDPDMVIRNRSRTGVPDLEQVIFDFQRSGHAAVCPRISIRPDGWLASLQELEYDLAYNLGRKSLADLSTNSGVSIYRRDALERVLQDHSLSVYAEDLENSILLLSRGESVYLDDRFVVETEATPDVGTLFSQRVGWSFGHIRVYFTRFAEIRRIARRRLVGAYQYIVYFGGIGLLMHPLRVVGCLFVMLGLLNGVDELLRLGAIPNSAFTNPMVFASTYVQYLFLVMVGWTVAVPAEDRLRLLPFVPLYFLFALFLVIPTTIGFANYLVVRWFGRRLFNDHYQDTAGLVAQQPWQGGAVGTLEAQEA